MSAANESPGPESQVEHAARLAILAAALICLGVIALGSLGLLSRLPLAVFTLGLFAFAVFSARSAASFSPRDLLPPWPLLIALPLLLLQTLVSLPLLPAEWDAMTYHLFLPARWLQEGSLVHVPTVFGDDSAAFAPQNGALFYAWWLGLANGDLGVGIIQVAGLGLLAAAVFLLVRRLGGSVLAAAMAVATLPWLEPVQHWTFSANVDIFMTAFWVAAAAFLLGGEGRRQDLLYGGLALGLALGTKTLAVPLAAGLVLLAAPRLRHAPRRDLLLFAGATALTGSYWWLRNLVCYGNPLFPLDLSLGSWRALPGVYPSSAVMHSVFHIAGLADWLKVVHTLWGTAICLLGLLGLAALIRHAARAVAGRRLALELALLAAGWTFFVWSGVPHNNQIRFLLPALALVLVGWGLLLDRIPRRLPQALVCGLAWLALAADSRPDLFLRHRLALLASPVDPRSAALAEADYALWRDGYLPFNRPETAPTRIAYSGGNVPYALVGPQLRNRVVYCNVQGRPEDDFHDFWLRTGKARYDSYLTGIYRGEENAATWIACLEKERIEAVVLFWVIPVDVPRSWRLDEGFPIERGFLRERPDLFRPMVQTERAEIWSVKPWASAATSP